MSKLRNGYFLIVPYLQFNMNILDDLNLGFGRKLPLVLQTEAAECGLACLAMVASYHGYRTD